MIYSSSSRVVSSLFQIPEFVPRVMVGGLNLLINEVSKRILTPKSESQMNSAERNENERRIASQKTFFNKDLVLFMEGTFDFNGATNNTVIPTVEDPALSLMYRKVSSIYDIDRVIEEAVGNGNAIKVLYIRAHGFMTSMGLGCGWNGVLSTTNFKKIKNFYKLDPNAIIIMEGCSVGLSKFFWDNLPEKIAKYSKRICLAPLGDSLGRLKNDRSSVIPKSALNKQFLVVNDYDVAMYEPGAKFEDIDGEAFEVGENGINWVVSSARAAGQIFKERCKELLDEAIDYIPLNLRF